VTDWLQSQSEQPQQQSPLTSRNLATVLSILHDESTIGASHWHSLSDADATADINAAAASATAAHLHLEQHLNFSVGQGHSGQLKFLTLALAGLALDAFRRVLGAQGRE
jgi:hypothetical protein